MNEDEEDRGAEALRARLTKNRVRLATLSAALGLTERAIYGAEGLPFIRLGTERWYSIAEVEAWLATRPRGHAGSAGSHAPQPLTPHRCRHAAVAVPGRRLPNNVLTD
jgi:hypothetical protein